MHVIFEDGTEKDITFDDIEWVACTGIYPLVDGKQFKEINLTYSYEDFCWMAFYLRPNLRRGK